MTPLTTPVSMSKRYRTLDGQAVTLLCADAGGMAPVIGLIGPSKLPGQWRSNGTCPLARMALVEIQPARTVFRNVYPDGSLGVSKHATLTACQHAERKVGSARVGILELTVDDGKVTTKVHPASKYEEPKF